MKFRDHQKENSPAPHVVTLSPKAFAHSFSKRPTADVAVGIRAISESDLATAKVEATKSVDAWLGTDSRGKTSAIEVWNDTFLRILVYRGTCDPNNSAQPFELFGGDDECVRLALTPESVKRLWDEVEAYAISISPVWDTISDAGATELAGVLTSKLDKFSPRMRRLAWFLLEQVRE